MKQWKYKSYQEYKDIQIEFTRKKSQNNASWVNPYDLGGIVSYINDYNKNASFGLCHGTRRGVEQLEFMKLFSMIGSEVEVLGTEINPDVANKTKNTIEWDFSKVKDEWINNVDFIYSNSFDHCYDAKKCFNTWMTCLNKNGLCFIEWCKHDGPECSRPGDPFGATYDEYEQMFNENHEVIDVLKNDPSKDNSWGKHTTLQRFYFVIRNKK